MISADDFVLFCERTIDSMTSVVGRLDDEQVNSRPELPGANTPFQVVTHALAACEWWTSHIVCGHPSDRRRDGEFTASGTVADLVGATAIAKDRLRALLPELSTATELHIDPQTRVPLGAPWTVGAALINAHKELAQHLGHLEITVDLLVEGQA